MTNRALLLAGTSLATSLVFVSAGSAWADSCIDLRTGQNYDCNGAPPQAAPGQPAPPPTQLRELLRKRLAQKDVPTTEAAQQRWADAANRAMQASASASLTSDPQEQAQAKAKYAAAVRDMQQAGNEVVAGTSDPAAKANMQAFFARTLGSVSQQASAAGIGAVQTQPQAIRDSVQQPAAPAAASAGASPQPRPDVFSVCEDPKNGVTTCYEMSRSGNDCLEVLYQGGQRTWENGRKTCRPEDLQQRDAYFSGQPVGQGAPADPRSQQLSGLMASLSPQCQQDVKSYLYRSRDSRTSGGAGDQAMRSFANINGNQDCKAGFERLASIVGVEIPQRHLSGGARSAWASGMADKPRETVNVPDVNNMPQGYYGPNDGGGGWNTGEVLDAGVQILGVLGAILGGFAEGYGGGGYSGGTVYSSGPSRGYGGPSGGGYVYRGSSRGSNSTITGTSR
ncbi:MAG TPA: hypothetical protein VKY24_11730 [Reyranella sp.]|nr:hypothetical protein [Reyranella sp.]